MSAYYTNISDISSDSDSENSDNLSVTASDRPDNSAYLAASYQEHDYGYFHHHPSFPFAILNDRRSPPNKKKFHSTHLWTTDQVLSVKFPRGVHQFTATTSALLNEIDQYVFATKY